MMIVHANGNRQQEWLYLCQTKQSIGQKLSKEKKGYYTMIKGSTKDGKTILSIYAAQHQDI
jgi:hypothetical protein